MDTSALRYVTAVIPQPPTRTDWQLVLRDLITLRQVGIEIVLACEYGARRDFALERYGDDGGQPHCCVVGDRQRPRQTEAHRTGVHVRRVAEFRSAAAEQLGPSPQLDMHFQSDDGLVICPGATAHAVILVDRPTRLRAPRGLLAC